MRPRGRERVERGSRCRAGYLLNERRTRLLGDEIPLVTLHSHFRAYVTPRSRYRHSSYPRLDLLFPGTRQIRPSAAFVPETRACPP